jgi:hypothetical protein
MQLTTFTSRKYEDKATNPDLASHESPEFLIAQALATSAQLHKAYYSTLSQWMGYTARSASFAPNVVLESFAITQSTFQSNWMNAYRLIHDLNMAEQRSQENEQPFFEGIAKIMRSWWFQNLVDMFNDVPYKDVLLQLQNPAYDNAKCIYEDLVGKIDEGIALIKSCEGPGRTERKFDLMWRGKKDKWIRLANTLKLRILIRQSGVNARYEYIQGEIAKIVEDGTGFLEENALIDPGFENGSYKQNPLHAAYFRAHQYAINFFTSTNDARVDFIYKKPAGGMHCGNWLGSSPNENNLASETGVGVVKTECTSYPFFLSCESFFLQAEAVERGWLSGNAKLLYQQGIEASFRYLEVPDATEAAASYYSQPGVVNVNWNDSPDKLRAIAMQKWAALNGFDALEAWTEYRRTGFPQIDPPSLSPHVLLNAIPVRALYPRLEYELNGGNVKKQGAINQFDSKIFWMK